MIIQRPHNLTVRSVFIHDPDNKKLRLQITYPQHRPDFDEISAG